MTFLTASDVEVLLDRLCTKLGFCLPPEARIELRTNPPTDAIAFTDAVFLAEGLDPETVDRHLYRQVRDSVNFAFQNAQNCDPS